MYWAKCDNQPQAAKSLSKASVDIMVFTLLAFVYDFITFPDHPIVMVQRLKESWCYDDSCDM